MKKNLFNEYNRIFFIGVGGISMSALCQLAVHFGADCAGSDVTMSHITNNLSSIGVKVFILHNAVNIKTFKPNLVVYTGAISSENPELLLAKKLNIKCLERADFLGLVCNQFNNVIAIGGTHGKTTTSAMISEIFVEAKLNPTCHIGGEVKNFNSNLRLGYNNYFITEACEYKKSFEKIYSVCAVVTNIERDHMDCYTNINDLRNAFKIFSENSSEHLVSGDLKLPYEVNKKLNVCTCGVADYYDYYADNLISNNGCYEFDCYEFGKFLMHFKLKCMGIYNVKNALYAICVARKFNIELNCIYNALINFNGVKRRNEFMGEINGVPVYADYCHHPTEIKSSILGYSEIYKNILCIFQPHTYSRTIALKKEFSTCFEKVKKLIVFKTYPAREKYNHSGSETALFKKVKLKNKVLALTESELKNELKINKNNYDVILVLGAGDLYNLFEDLNNFN